MKAVFQKIALLALSLVALAASKEKGIDVRTLNQVRVLKRSIDARQRTIYVKEWTKHPVFHFDMSTAKHMQPSNLINEIEGKLSQLEQIYGTEEWAISTNQRLECLVKRAYKQTGQKVVLLIDESSFAAAVCGCAAIPASTAHTNHTPMAFDFFAVLCFRRRFQQSSR